MNLDFLRRASVWILRVTKPRENIDKSKKIISRFSSPINDMQRSWYQYKCQGKQNGWLHTLISNTVALVLFPILMLKAQRSPECVEQYDVVLAKNANEPNNTVPACVEAEFVTKQFSPTDGAYIGPDDKRWILKVLFRHPFSPAFAFKILLRMSRYGYLINKYHPKALIVHNEYSFTSSLMTEYCNNHGVELINVMHGEKVYSIRDSFFRFNRCYVWNDFYRDLFIELRADPDQFIVAVPPSLLFAESDVAKTVDYTYYLQDQQGDELRKIVNIMAGLRDKGASVCIRPHPRYTNFAELDAFAAKQDVAVENWREVSVEQSVLRSRHAVSIYSTVLLQAYYNGTAPVIDDISNPELISDLREKKYIMLSLEHKKMSELLKKEVMT